MGRRKRKISKPINNTYAIVVDGKTEVWYFQMMKRNETNLQVKIEPKIPQKKKLSEQYKKVLELAEVYTKVFWVIDLDDVISESNFLELKEYRKILETKNNNIITIFNNPCLEFWFLLHFEQTTKYFPRCSKAEKQLKKHIPTYEKTQKYFTKQDQDIYLKLKPKLSKSLINSKKTQKVCTDHIQHCGISEMNLFFETEQIEKAIKLNS